MKDLNFPQVITATTASPNYGCANTVSYSLNTYTCTNFCSSVYTVGAYSITWQAPAGWVQTSLTNNGSNVSFTPEATSAGSLIATIQLPCGYTETRTFTITRTAQPPTFTNASVSSCTSSASLSINSTCGASDYTYTIVGNSGVTFASNGLQTLTSASTSINISTSGGSSATSIKAKANYPNSISSAETSASLTFGSPTVSITSNTSSCFGTYQTWSLSAEPTSYGSNWQWTVDYLDPGSDIYIDNPNSPFTNVDVSGLGTVRLTYTGLCGAAQTDGVTVYSNCGGGYAYALAPNPTSGDLQVSSIDKKTNIKEIKITDKTGAVKKRFVYSQNITSVKIDITSLPPNIYYVQIYDGKKWSSKAISKK